MVEAVEALEVVLEWIELAETCGGPLMTLVPSIRLMGFF